MYLFLKAKIEEEFPQMVCERADYQAMTGQLTDKVRRSIRSADVVIADCTGANPNVLYELGIAHAHEKPTLLLTADTPESAPTDIRGYEFIQYSFDDENSLMRRVNRALQSIVASPDNDYEWAQQILSEYTNATGTHLTAVDSDEFERRVVHKLGPGESTSRRVEVMLPEIIEERLTIQDALAMQEWIDTRYRTEGDSAPDANSDGTNTGDSAT